MLLIPVILNLVWQHILTNPSIPRALPPLLQPLALALSKGSGSILPPTWTNPFEAMIYPPHPVLLDDGRRDPRDVFKRGPLDLLFIGYHIVFWCFVRQAVTMYILKPLAARLGIRGAKVERFTEQGYAIAYFGFFGSFGVWIMKDLPIWCKPKALCKRILRADVASCFRVQNGSDVDDLPGDRSASSP